REMIRLLIAAADRMDAIFWLQSYGPPQPLLESIENRHLRRFAEINYGPWDRLDGNRPFIDGVGPKPLGAQFYPADMTAEEFTAYVEANPAQAESLKSQYTLVRRDGDRLRAIP